MKHFNVSLITMDDYPHSLALLEVAQYVHACLAACGHRATLSTSYIDPDAHNIVFCAHLLKADQLDHLPADTIIFNSEQLQKGQAWYFDGPYRQFLDKFYVWDYSLKNLPLLGHDRSCFIPLLYCPELDRAGDVRNAAHRLCFYGGPAERRTKLIGAIEAAQVPVDVIVGKYGAERDDVMFQSWAVLNLRNADDVSTFELVRCFYPLINGIPVISELASRDPTFDFYKDWIFAFDTATLAHETAALYHNPDAFARQAEEKLASFRETSGAEAIADAVEVYMQAVS